MRIRIFNCGNLWSRRMTDSMEKIGHGVFSDVYKVNEYTVLFKTTCKVKHCLADSNIDNDFFPELWINLGEIYGHRYHKLESPKNQLKDWHYHMYEYLIDFRQFKEPISKKNFSNCPFNELKAALLSMLDIIQFDDDEEVYLDVTSTNLMVDVHGNLILNDIFYITKKG